VNILLVISTLGAGGAERVLSTMANYWHERDHVVTVVTIDSPESDFYRLREGIHRVSLGLKRDSKTIWDALRNNLQRTAALRKVFVRVNPDVIISFVDTANILTLLASIKLNIPVVVSERIDPRHHAIGKSWDLMRCAIYPLASAVVVQTRDVCEWLQANMPRARVISIPNFVREAAPRTLSGYALPSNKTILAIGRLSPQKDFRTLIQAFAQCTGEFPEWHLVIFGEGSERDNLLAIAAECGVTEKVYLPGLIDEPMDVLPKAEIFVLSSRYEGFPNVLLEAMVCGTAVISTDCPSGPRDIVVHDKNGLLISPGNVAEMANAMKRLMGDGGTRKRLGASALEVRQRYAISKILEEWENLLQKLVVHNTGARRCR
jgi:GalNAc-alpha-(1->4)-GalNAc-alpha-(1->3)-diNAcBac-PP-undecaprenol alpha-1,4-N-acetyl-D-galactosaminyltransferase